MNKVVFFGLLICLFITNATEADFYVDGVNGNNMYPGTEALPFQTLERARDAIRRFFLTWIPCGIRKELGYVQ